MNRRLKTASLAALVAAVLFPATAPAAIEFPAVIAPGQRVLAVENPFPETVTPTVVVRGVTDYEADPVRFTEEPALAGHRLAGRLLTGSVLTLNPNDTGVWMYDGGFHGFDPAVPREEAANPVEYLKYRWDTVGGARVFDHAAGVRFLRLAAGRPVVYPLAFPEGVEIRSVRVVAGHRALERGQEITFTLSRDEAGRDPVGAYTVSPGGISPEAPGRDRRFTVRHPVGLGADGPVTGVNGYRLVFDDVSSAGAWLSITLAPGGNNFALVGPLHLTAWLDTGGITLPRLAPGASALEYGEAEHSSGRAELLVRLPEVPEKEMVLSDFETGAGRWRAVANAELAWSEGLAGGAFRGEGYLRVRLDPRDGDDGGVSQATVDFSPRETDWSDYNRLELALNTLGLAPGGATRRVRIGMFSRPEGYTHLLWVGANDTWLRHSIDISGAGRSNVRWLRVSTYGNRWDSESSFTLYLDDVRLARYPEAAGEEAAADDPEARPGEAEAAGLEASRARALRANIGRLLALEPEPLPEAQQAARAHEFFPMGVWSAGTVSRNMALAGALGFDPWDGFRAMLRDLRANGMNSLMGSSHPFDRDEGRYFDLLEESGIRAWTYGPQYFHDQGSPEANRAWFESHVAPNARRRAPAAAGRWGLLAWGLTEEIQARMVPDLERYYALMAEIAPDQDIVIVHNHLGPQERQAALFPGRRVLAWDRYPFRQYWLDPLRTWSAGIDEHYRVARSIDANLWVVLQSYNDSTLTPGGNIYFSRRISHPLQMKAQAWVAVGRGATGLYAYLYDLVSFEDPGHYTAFKTVDGDDTPAWRAWAEALAEIEPYVPLLLKLRRLDEVAAESSDERVWVTTFAARPGVEMPGTWLVAVNADWERERTFSLELARPGVLYDEADGRRLTAEEAAALAIPAGSGRVFRLE